MREMREGEYLIKVDALRRQARRSVKGGVLGPEYRAMNAIEDGVLFGKGCELSAEEAEALYRWILRKVGAKR